MDYRAVIVVAILNNACHQNYAKLNVIPRDTEVKINDSTYMNCSTSLRANLIQWLHGKYYIYTGQAILEPYDDGRFSIDIDTSTGTSNLVIRSVQPTDAGKYECLEDEGFGEKGTAELIVLDADPVCTSNVNPDGVIGPNSCDFRAEEIRLSCSIKYHGNVLPILKWKADRDKEFITDGLFNVTNINNEVTYSLTIKSDLDINNSFFICQTTRMTRKPYTCSSTTINILYVFSSKLTMNMTLNDEVSCFVNTSQSCNYKWKWFSGDDVSTESDNKVLKPKKVGWHRCEATCSFRNKSCRVESMQAKVYSDAATERQNLMPLLVLLLLPPLVVIGVIMYMYMYRWRKRKIEKKEDQRMPEEQRLFDDQLPEMRAKKGQHKKIRWLNKLPLEILDIILQKSYRHWIFNSLAKQKDEEAIRSLIAVDVCFNRRITGKRFKKAIWRYLKAIYHELDRKSAILKNNNSYLAENIRTQDLTKQLRSSNCLSDVKARLICRIPVTAIQPKLLGKRGPKFGSQDTSELLHIVRRFDDAQLSTFIHCLRQWNQKLLARIAENGGVVVRTNIVTRSPVADFNHLRRKHKPSSRQTDELNYYDIEVLNVARNRQTNDLWIWCKSPKGLDNLRELYENKELLNVLIGSTYMYIWSTAEVLKSAATCIRICSDQFKKTVAVRELGIELTKSLGVNTSVRGVTKLRNEIYVLCQSNDRSPTVICVYQDDTPFNLLSKFKITECRLSCDIVSSEEDNCLYIGDLRNGSIWQITITSRKDGQYMYEAIHWSTCNYKPYTMSTSGDGDLLIIEESDLPVLARYAADGALRRKIQLPYVIKYPHHAVETSTGDFIIIDEPKDEEIEDSSSRRLSEKKSVWRLHHVTGDGQMVVRSKELSSETQEVKDPWHLSLYSEDQVFMASSKVILLNSDFTLRATVDERIPTTGSRRLFYDDEKRQLIVGGPGKRVDVYSLTMK